MGFFDNVPVLSGVEDAAGTAATAAADVPADVVNEAGHQLGLTEGEDTGIPGESADQLGTIATGTVDSFIADPGNAILGVDAPEMGIFEGDAAGGRTVSIGSLGLAGEGGLLTEPGQFTDNILGGSGGQQGQEQPSQASGLAGLLSSPIVLIGLAAAAVALIVGGDR